MKEMRYNARNCNKRHKAVKSRAYCGLINCICGLEVSAGAAFPQGRERSCS
jgi:hypothetical protein